MRSLTVRPRALTFYRKETMQSIILTGYMCVGKTTVGRALAKRLHCTFYDLDWYIEERYHTQVSRIFAEEGEAAFRDKERRMLHEVAAFENVVLSCGGGTPCFFDNMDYINQQGETVYLKCTTDVLYQHLKMGHTVRPLLLDKTPEEVRQFIEQQLTEREAYYKQAKHTIDVSLMDNYEKIKITVKAIERELGLGK